MAKYHQYSAALELVKQQQEDSADKIEKYRVICKKYMNESVVGHIYENFNLVISALSAFQRIYITYLVEKDAGRYQFEHRLASLLSLVFISLFAVDWTLNIFLADSKKTFLWSLPSVIDIITIVTTVITLPLHPPTLTGHSTAGEYVKYIIYALSTVRILRVLRLSKEFELIEDAVARFLAEISLNVVGFVLFYAALVQFLEQHTNPYHFHTWTYYVWVTISTVGYGDITPDTMPGRIAAMTMIGFAVISVPKFTNELIEKMSLQSVYMRAAYVPKSRSSKHVLICGDIASTSLRNFFEELFHEDHENADLNAVILLPLGPTVETILLMREPKYAFVSVYLEGSALVGADLRRAKAEAADAIFIMTNKFAANPDEEDAKSILLNLSIKRYLAMQLRTRMLYCTQLIRPENRRHLSKNDANQLDENDLVVCLNEIKMGAMAKAVLCPGANTLIMNLVTSFSDSALGGGEDEEHSSVFGEKPRKSITWLSEYEKGCGWEIYTTPLSSVFEGANFAELSYGLFERIGVVLFALEITDRKEGGRPRLVLNPASYCIPSQEEFSIKAFVIAKNQASSDLSFSGGLGETFQDLSPLTSLPRNIGTYVRTQASVINQTVGRRFSTVLGGRAKIASTAPELQSLTEAGGPNELSGGAPATNVSAKAAPRASRWDTLKKTSTQERKNQAQSYQEVLTQLEDEHFTHNYYVSPMPCELADVTVKNSVFEEVPFINQHLIILGKGIKNLYDFIRPLRAKYLPMHYIVVIYPDEIPHDVWQRISIFEAILVVRGSPLEESTLRRAGIFRAAQVVVLADGSCGADGSVGMEALADSDAIFAYQLVKRMNPSAQMLVEVVNQSNIAYIHDDLYDEDTDHALAVHVDAPRFAPSFAAGNLFTTSFLDSIVCQSYYNPLIIKVINELISGVDQADRADLLLEAAGIVADSMRADEAGATKDRGFLARVSLSSKLKSAVLELNAKGKSRLSSIKSSYLYQIALPDALETRTYGALYKHLSGQGMVPLGILRGSFPAMGMGALGNKLPYVFANPSKDTALYTCDRIFVLSAKPVGVNPGQGSMRDVVADLQTQRGRTRSSSGDVPRLVRSRPNSRPGSSTRSRPTSAASRRLAGEPDEMNKMLGNIMSLMEQTMSPSGPGSSMGTPMHRSRKMAPSADGPSPAHSAKQTPLREDPPPKVEHWPPVEIPQTKAQKSVADFLSALRA